MFFVVCDLIFVVCDLVFFVLKNNDCLQRIHYIYLLNFYVYYNLYVLRHHEDEEEEPILAKLLERF
jgi:hypothetical protein